MLLIILVTLTNCRNKQNEVMPLDMNGVKEAINVAKQAKEKGNLPYGSVLTDANGKVLLKGENTINTDNDCLAHAEINLIREACKLYDYKFLNSCVIYTSDEPCAMCSSAIYWSGIGKLVFGLSKKTFYDSFGRENPNWVFELGSREVFSKGGRKVKVVGPMLEDDVLKIHKIN
ncbi:nucleoside deaminase [Pontimicrobium aquaticum]|nr:nucleoside deaminase [Pontimicrobium aquaticum]